MISVGDEPAVVAEADVQIGWVIIDVDQGRREISVLFFSFDFNLLDVQGKVFCQTPGKTLTRKKGWICFYIGQRFHLPDECIQRLLLIGSHAMDIFGIGKKTDENNAGFDKNYFSI